MIFDRASLNALFRYCLALCGKHEDAYDLLQDSVEKYLQQKDSPIHNEKAFIRRIARNRFFDLQRRRKIVQFDSLEGADNCLDSEKDLESLMVDELTLKKVWQTLSAAERDGAFALATHAHAL